MRSRILAIQTVLATVVAARPNYDGVPGVYHDLDHDSEWRDYGEGWGPGDVRWGHGDRRWGHSGEKWGYGRDKGGPGWYPGSWDGKWIDWHKHFPWFNGHDISYFDEIIIVDAVPEQVVSSSLARRSTLSNYGQSGASGIFRLAINIADKVICYNITISGLTSSSSAVQLHQGARGINGPAVISFPVSTGSNDPHNESGCLTVSPSSDSSPTSSTVSSSTYSTASSTSTTELSTTGTDSVSSSTTESSTSSTASPSTSTVEPTTTTTELSTSSTTSISSSTTSLPPIGKMRRDDTPGSTAFDLSQIISSTSEYYVEVDTTGYPNGAIRGQLRKWYRGWGWGWNPNHP